MKGSWHSAVALLIAFTIVLIFLHPATSVLPGRQAKMFGPFQLVMLAVIALMLPPVAIDRFSSTSDCQVGHSGSELITFLCSFLC